MDTRIKNYLGVALIFGILVSSFAAWGYVHSIEPDSFRSFVVRGEGKIVAVPDVAQFTFSVITEGGLNLESLQSSNTEKANEAIEYLKDEGIDKKDIQTSGFSIIPRRPAINCFTFPCAEADITGYQVNQTVTVKVRDDFDKAGKLLTGVVERGANSVSQLFFTIDDPTEVENEAREKAFEDAKRKAKLIADAGGFKVGKLLSIDEGGGFYPYEYDTAVSRAQSGGGGFGEGPAVTIEPGSRDIVINLTLRYEIR